MVELLGKDQLPLLRTAILAGICVLAFIVRLNAVLRFESVIHEFDPYFNFRTTKYLVENGFYEFHNWFDDRAWYPLGRIIGGTIYPGLMVTAAAMYNALHALHFTIDIRNVCVFTAPLFASFTTLVTYFMGREVKSEGAGMLAAGLIAIVPGYISRSVAGSYDNEAVAIFALLLTYTLWIRAVNTGSLSWAGACALAYFYMVSAWGGYVFIINLIPLYTLVMVVSGRFSHRLYVAYSSFYMLGTLLSMQIAFVGFQPVQSSEHMAAAGMFVFLQAYVGVAWLRSLLAPESFDALLRLLLVSIGSVGALGVGAALATGYISPFTGRFYVMLDPTYASKHIPIIASLNDGNVFVIIYAIAAVYFSGVMVRLMLILAPVAHPPRRAAQRGGADSGSSKGGSSRKSSSKKGKGAGQPEYVREVAAVMVAGVMVFLVLYTYHCSWVTAEAYSSPSIVLAAGQRDGSRIIFDDFREAYWWLRHNTPEDARVMSWWDYGYQISAMANRTIIVDNNTWNNTHISQVGRAMASPEEDAYLIMKRLDVNYVLVIFGGLTGYSSDDINKFLWMVRIGNSTTSDVLPDSRIIESEYFSPKGEFKIDSSGSPRMLNCLMYKLCYYRFGEVYTDGGQPAGYDRVRQVEIGNKDIELDYMEEAYTTEHWLVRIYKVKDPELFA
ncbi:dolichyl-diphosphooligosaccharide-protein glycosyltransferase subunit STT3A [Thecamonas trahens ATCC 50062]|uniref:dolichyl-diphosphooligosaccharide--protein glycotransferase n=1 Tax=Thecamonas trahens ATCC 50062 TaxID=461836 RepID=A0A0L0D6R6_THETB|nr:dolichyl-diphosphooligosaccharide-protein glycosyltransferase subunit STT3A [Thecamonas trahens ATCC 50062]KNC46998.1 dolichyl-diphosphooligosaccharide-protein glycosyltransferase subunit STT3A [Thecamonas trahens ATCC 50062]|eukprot:XP_013759781.1 dolichyl-diphosphooligosaccharide-protein glycosyltransferase subunit STT3A [Thecamonas trahens ATCC 50062]